MFVGENDDKLVDVGVSYLELHGFPINGGHTDVQKPIVAGAFGFQWDYPLVLFLVPILAMWDGVGWLLVLRLSWCLSKGSSLPGDQRSVDNPNGRLECPSCLRYLHYFLNGVMEYPSLRYFMVFIRFYYVTRSRSITSRALNLNLITVTAEVEGGGG